VTLEQDYAFHGKVFSRRDACERNRTVAVYQVRPGADGLYDATRSNAEGRWEVLGRCAPRRVLRGRQGPLR
jgi:hypothetical protein